MPDEAGFDKIREAPKPERQRAASEPPKENKPLDAPEQGIINHIVQDGDEDSVLIDIASGKAFREKPSANPETTSNPSRPENPLGQLNSPESGLRVKPPPVEIEEVIPSNPNAENGLLRIKENVKYMPMAENLESPNPVDQPTNSRWSFLKSLPSRLAKRVSPDRSPERNESALKLAQARNQIIDSILTAGLLTGETLNTQGNQFLGSTDKELNTHLFGRVLRPVGQYRDERVYRNSIDQALYNTDDSCLTVVVERPGESLQDRHIFNSPKERKDEISRRALASFILVCRAEPVKPFKEEHRGESQTKPEDFEYVIIPQQILADYGTDKLNQKGFKVKGVRKEINRSLQAGDAIKIPDYESALDEILRAVDHPVWVHAVRLPTEEDLQSKQSAQKSPINQGANERNRTPTLRRGNPKTDSTN